MTRSCHLAGAADLFRQLAKMKCAKRAHTFDAMHSSARSCSLIRKKLFVIKETKLKLPERTVQPLEILRWEEMIGVVLTLFALSGLMLLNFEIKEVVNLIYHIIVSYCVF